MRRPPKAGLSDGAAITFSTRDALLAPAKNYRGSRKAYGVYSALAIIRLIAAGLEARLGAA